jgi:putative transposase
MKKADKKHSTSRLCQLFSVPVASYYYPSKDNPQELSYVTRMKEIHRNNHQSYEKRRIKVALENQGIFLGVFKIARLMKSAGIIAKVPKKPHYYPSGKQLPTIPNILKRQFNQDKINTHWVGDITYIRNHQGWSYLATVLDLGS